VEVQEVGLMVREISLEEVVVHIQGLMLLPPLHLEIMQFL